MEPAKWFRTLSFKKLGLIKPKKQARSSTSGSPRTPKSPVNICAPSAREEELKEVFRRFDCDGDGRISAVELRSYFATMGEYMSYEDAQVVINHLDRDKDDFLDFQDFLGLMEDNAAEGEEDLRAAFGVFEMEKGCGRITAESLRRVLGRLGHPKTYDECEAMIRVFDSEGKGGLGFHEFQQMMMAA